VRQRPAHHEGRTRRRRLTVANGLLLLLAVACLGLLVSQIRFDEFAATFRRIPASLVAAGFAAALASYLLKALRYALVLRSGAGVGRLFGVTVAQNVIGQLFPARAGDVGYVLLVKRAGIASYGHGVASLLVCRFVDLAVLWGMYVFAMSRLDLQSAVVRWVAIVIAAGLLVAVLAVAGLLFFRQAAVRTLERVFRVLRLDQLAVARRVWDEVRTAASQSARMWSFGVVLGVLGLSLLIWAARVSWNYLVWCAVGAPLNLAQIIFITSLGDLLGLLPIFVLGGVGTADAVNAGVLVAFGYAGNAAAGATLLNRVLTTAYQLLLSAVALPFLRKAHDAAKGEGGADGR